MWKAFAEHFKECGRNGALFVFALVGVILTMLVTSVVGIIGITTLWIAWSILLFRSCVKFVGDWKNPARLGKLPPLSQHDLRIARSKLVNRRNPQSN